MTDIIKTAKAGTNADLFPDILRLYVPEGSRVLDMTYGKGVFWKKVDTSKYQLDTNDISEDRGDSHYDFRNIPVADASYDAAILDPPYMFIHRPSGGGRIKASIDKGYGNNARYDQGDGGPDKVRSYYIDGAREALRLLVVKGTLIVKCMDQVFSGKQWWEHIFLYDAITQLGYHMIDLFVLVQSGTPTMRHKHQVHARKNHSYFLVFRKPK